MSKITREELNKINNITSKISRLRDLITADDIKPEKQVFKCYCGKNNLTKRGCCDDKDCIPY